MTESILCVKVPNPKPLKISLPFGGELKSMMDLSKGPPSDCSLIHSLMLQLAPMLAGLQCFFKVLNLVAVLQNISVDTLPKIAAAAAEVAGCLNFAANIPCMIVDILKLIIAYLKCMIEAIESLLKFQIGINFNEAEGNPILLASLNCAQGNADASMAQLKEALAVIQPLLSIVTPIADMAAGPLPGPAGDALKLIPKILATISTVLDSGGVAVGVPGAEEPLRTLAEVKSVLEEVQQALDAIPC